MVFACGSCFGFVLVVREDTNHGDTVMLQKLNYIHRNPVVDRWQLAVNTSDCYFSSAKFYETGERDFSFLKDVRELF